MNLLDKLAYECWSDVRHNLKYAARVNRNMVWCRANSKQQIYPFGVPLKTPGIYCFWKVSDNIDKTPPIYIGETGDCVSGRIKSHLKSLRDRNSVKEATHDKFLEHGIDLNTDISVYYLTAEDVGAICKADLLTVESLLMRHLQPITLANKTKLLR